MGGMPLGKRDKGDLFCIGNAGGSGYTSGGVPGS